MEPIDVQGFEKIPFQAPDFLEEAFGYRKSDARYVAFYWGSGDELFCEDSEGYGGTIDHAAWLMWKNHPLRIVFGGRNFGYSDLEAEYWLLLDRETRDLWAGKVSDVLDFLKSKRPKIEPVTLTQEEWDDITEKMWQKIQEAPKPTHEDIMALLREEHERVKRLEAWLDEQLRNVIEAAIEEGRLMEAGWNFWIDTARKYLESREAREATCH